MTGKIFQLDLFRSEKENQHELEMKQLKSSTQRGIRALFARSNELEYVVLEMHKKIERLENEVFKNG